MSCNGVSIFIFAWYLTSVQAGCAQIREDNDKKFRKAQKRNEDVTEWVVCNNMILQGDPGNQTVTMSEFSDKVFFGVYAGSVDQDDWKTNFQCSPASARKENHRNQQCNNIDGQPPSMHRNGLLRIKWEPVGGEKQEVVDLEFNEKTPGRAFLLDCTVYSNEEPHEKKKTAKNYLNGQLGVFVARSPEYCPSHVFESIEEAAQGMVDGSKNYFEYPSRLARPFQERDAWAAFAIPGSSNNGTKHWKKLVDSSTKVDQTSLREALFGKENEKNKDNKYFQDNDGTTRRQCRYWGYMDRGDGLPGRHYGWYTWDIECTIRSFVSFGFFVFVAYYSSYLWHQNFYERPFVVIEMEGDDSPESPTGEASNIENPAPGFKDPVLEEILRTR